MKIAIRGHSTRGKEVIQIFKDLGTEGLMDHTGSHIDWVYLRDDSLCYKKLIVVTNTSFLKGYDYKIYTLEEFEKEFPFKIGETVVTTLNHVGTIIGIVNSKYKVLFKEDSALVAPRRLKPYKEMKEERNIALTLDKAKEWYKKGGELREIALQAFTEKELNVLPRSWEEFCRQGNPVASWRYAIPTKYEALFKLEQLRDCWRQGNIPQEIKYKIRKVRNIYTVVYGAENAFLSFCDNQTAEEFLECFKDLIEKAGDLI